MTWFGASWRAPICDPGQRVETPVGARCAHCEERVETGDRGVFIDNEPRPLHFECFMRGIVGSVGHQKGTCGCYGGSEDDPPGATPREAARAALEYLEDQPPKPLMEIPIPDRALKNLAAIVREVVLRMLARHRNN
jgi:hypothetical protein